jgi:hypothetical protein
MNTSTLKWLPLALVATAASLLTSCGGGGPVKVVIDNADGDTCTVVIDGKTTLKMIGDTAITVELKPGTHNVAVNKEKPREFKVGGKGGLLNIDNVDYIAFEVEYAPQNKYGNDNLNMHNMRITDMVVVDSFLIREKSKFRLMSDSVLRKRLPEFMSDPDGNIGIGKFEHEGLNGLKKVGKNQLFVDRFWDYHINEEMPETIEIRTRKGDIMTSSTRSKITRASTFLIMAMINRDIYEVRSFESIRSGKKPESEAGADVEETTDDEQAGEVPPPPKAGN